MTKPFDMDEARASIEAFRKSGVSSGCLTERPYPDSYPDLWRVGIDCRDYVAVIQWLAMADKTLPAALARIAELEAERNQFERAWKNATVAVDVGKEAVRQAHADAREETNAILGEELAAHSETRAELHEVRRRERQCMALVEKTERARDAALAEVVRVTAELAGARGKQARSAMYAEVAMTGAQALTRSIDRMRPVVEAAGAWRADKDRMRNGGDMKHLALCDAIDAYAQPAKEPT